MTTLDYIGYFRSLIEREPSAAHWNDWWEAHQTEMVKLVSRGMYLRLTSPGTHTKLLAIYAILREAGFDYAWAEHYDIHPKFWEPCPVPISWLKKRTSFGEIEAVIGKWPKMPPNFSIIKDIFRPGDEVWTFCSPPRTWAALMGRQGFAFVRDGVPYEQIITVMN